MAKQRKTQLYRNSTISNFQTYSEAYSGVKETLESQKSNLEDGEVILGRYLVNDNEQNLVPGILVGVARKSDNTVTLDILPDSHYVENAVGDANAYTVEQINALALATTQLSSVSSHGNDSSFKVYSVKQTDGQVAVSTSDYQELVMDGQYDASSNKVALQTTVDAKIAALNTSADIAFLSNGLLTLTNQINETNGVISGNGNTSIWFASNPTQNNKVVTQAELTGIVGAMVYKGTVSSNAGLPTSGVQPGWTYVVDTAGTYAGKQCEVGDMIIAKIGTPNPEWNIVSGENQYELGNATVSVNVDAPTIIGTFEGSPLEITVYDDYASLSGTADAALQSLQDYIETPNSDFKVVRSITQDHGHITIGTVCAIKKVAATGAASDVSVTGLTGTNVQAVLESISGSISDSNTTINSLHGNFTVDTNTMNNINDDHRLLQVKLNSNGYIRSGSNGLDLTKVDTAGTSSTDSDLATVKTVNTKINALDGTVNASLVANSLTPTGTVDVLTAVQETNGVLTTGTKVTLATVAHSGSARDIQTAADVLTDLGADVLSALDTLRERTDNLSVHGGNGINVVKTSNDYGVNITLSTNAHAIGSTAYNTNASNLLLIGSDGKLTIEDTWDCGTY